MKLRELEAHRLPGLEGRLVLRDLAPGLNLVIGPNASGKTSLCRALRASLWPQAVPAALRGSWLEKVDLEVLWQSADRALRVRLQAGTTHWRCGEEAVSAPQLPPARQAPAYVLGMRDLLTEDGQGDRELIERIRIEMAGGFDLSELRDHELGRHFGRSEQRALSEAERALRQLEGDRKRLAEEEDRLAELGEELRGAAASRQEIAPLERALELDALRRSLRDRRAELDDLSAPVAEMELLSGGEGEQLAQWEEDLENARRQREEQDRALKQAERAKAECALALGPPAAAELEHWQRQARELEREQIEAASRARELENARAAREAAAAALSIDAGQKGPIESLSAADLSEVERWLQQACVLRQRRERAQVDLEALSRSIAADESAGSEQDGGRRLVAAVGLAALLGSALAVWSLAAPAATRFELLRALLGGILLGGALLLWWGRVRRHGDRRQRALGEQSALRRELDRIEREEQAVALERERLREGLGLDPGVGDLALLDLARALECWRAAVRTERECAERCAGLESTLSERRRALSQWIDAVLADEPADADLAVARFEDLRIRVERWREAEAQRERAGAALEECERQIGRIEARRSALLHGCKLAREGEDSSVARMRLETRLAELEQYRALRSDARGLERRIAELERCLREFDEGLLECPVERLERRLESARKAVESAHRIDNEIGRIEERIAAAGRSDELERRRAAVLEAREALAGRCREWMLARAEALLLARVERNHARASRPAVLSRAMRCFSAFTCDRYRLEFEQQGREGRYLARETASGRRMALRELSDGTRMQLLLAARLGFAIEGEEDLQPPLFLDEALSASDPERFRAVASALLEFVEGGRQIFYLTCNPADVELWQQIVSEAAGAPAHVIELGRTRNAQQRLRDPRRLLVPARPAVPSPDGHTPESYAAAIGLPDPDPLAGVEHLHLFHLLRDDLPLLHDLLERARIERVGHWRALCARNGAEIFCGPQDRDRLQARIALAEALLEARSIGRGRPIDRESLLRSDQVSEGFIDRLSDLASEKRGDARAFLAAIDGRDPRARRFQKDKRAELEQFFREEGHLDSRPVLDEHALRAHVFGEIRHLLPPAGAGLRVEEASDLIDTLIRLFRSSAGGRELGRPGSEC